MRSQEAAQVKQPVASQRSQLAEHGRQCVPLALMKKAEVAGRHGAHVKSG